MSDSGSHTDSPPAQAPHQQQAAKRKASVAGIDIAIPGRSVKRRAAKACVCCRARKVRCNVTEHGAPCTNCRLDEVECIVSESRRKKNRSKDEEDAAQLGNTSVLSSSGTAATTANSARKPSTVLASRDALDGIRSLAAANAAAAASAERRKSSNDNGDGARDGHVPHSIYQSNGLAPGYSFHGLNRRLSTSSQSPAPPLFAYPPVPNDGRPYFPHLAASPYRAANLPLFIKPLPPRIGPDEVAYLEKKGALTLPDPGFRNELLRSYVEFVHPYMPLLDLQDFVSIVDQSDESTGRISLILFQAVMFAGSAFVDMSHLRKAGYSTRKEARKDFFQKARLLYDFDYESDRVSLVQALLLLTYYYETPDDQKDTWHWMGVATSVAHTIGLHRNPESSNMEPKRVKLWKRIWWSTYMRDRLIALGMRRPTRIKAEDYDVPMLTIDDFDLSPLPENTACIPRDCEVAWNVDLQRQLAIMCIEKAKLCLCISLVLSKQYCVLNNNQGKSSDKTTMMLLPKKLDPEKCEVKACDEQLQRWFDELPSEAQYNEQLSGNNGIDLCRSLLHLVFYTTLSALHRPQVLPSIPTISAGEELLDVSRRNVRRAANAITSIAQRLDERDLVKYLPTSGVTVLLPAIIIHLLDIKAPDEETRRTSLRGFCQCMQVMGKLRDMYAAADYSTAFLEAAIRKAGIHITPTVAEGQEADGGEAQRSPMPPPLHKARHHITSVHDLVEHGKQLDNPPTAASARTLTPPPDSAGSDTINPRAVTDEEVARRLENYLASTPPDSNTSDHGHENDSQEGQGSQRQFMGQNGEQAIDPSALEGAVDLFPNFESSSSATKPHNMLNPTSNLFKDLPSVNSSNKLTSWTLQTDLDGMNDTLDFEALLNLDAAGESVTANLNVFDDVGDVALQGESSGLLGDVDWMRGDGF